MDVVGADDGAFANFGETVDDSLDIFGMNVEPLGSHDHVLLAAAVVKAAFGIDLAEVARVQPLAGGRYAFAADEDFAVGGDDHILISNHFAERSGFDVERMIDGDDRARFGETVSLNDGEAQPLPELFESGIDACAAHNKSPEFPSE